MTMERHYDDKYFFAEKYGFKTYRRPNGTIGQFGYTHGGMWSFDKILHKLIELLGVPETVLDVGAGCGGWVATLNSYGIDALGLEFSQYAIDNAILNAKPYLKRWDVEQTPWPVEKRYDWTTCFPGDTQVLSLEGWRDIASIQEGDTIKTHLGWSKVTKRFVRPYQGTLVEIKPRYAPPIVATPDHRFLAVKRRPTYSVGKFFETDFREEWIQAQDLKPRDFIVFTIPKDIHDIQKIDLLSLIGRGDQTKFQLYSKTLELAEQGCTLDSIKEKTGVPRKTAHQWIRGEKNPRGVILEDEDELLGMPKSHKVKRFLDVDEYFMEILGLYLGDGSTNKTNVLFSYGENDNAIERTIELAERVFGVKATVNKATYEVNIVIPSKIVAMFFKVIFGGQHAHEKKMPGWFLFLPVNKQQALIRGLIQSDGCIGNYDGRKRVSIITTSKTLAGQIWLILMRLGILSTLRLRKKSATESKIKQKHASYHITYNEGAKFKASKICGDKAYLPVYKTNVVAFNGLVYNLETEHNSYLTMSGIAHNCIDLFEHLFADKVDSVIAECKRVAKKWIVAKICTAQKPEEVYAAKRLATYEETYAQAVKDGFEWLIVSGHVNSQFPQYWRDKFQDNKWRLRDDLAERLKKDLNLPDDWRCTIIAENTKWFEEEFE